MLCAALPVGERPKYDNPTNLFTNFGTTAEPWVFGLVAAYSLFTVPAEAGRVIRDRKLYTGEGTMYDVVKPRFSGDYDDMQSRAYFRTLNSKVNTTMLHMITSSMFYPSFFSVYENAVTPYVQFITGASKTMLTSKIIHSRNSHKK